VSDGPQFLDEPTKHVDPGAPQPPNPDDRGWLDGVVMDEGAVQHDPVEMLAPITSPATNSAMRFGVVALLVLITGIASLELANFVAAQFDRSIWLGSLSIAIIIPASSVLVWSILREWRSYYALAQVERLRKGLASQDLAVARTYAREWLTIIGAPAETRKGVDAAPDASTIRALLQAGPMVRMEQETKAAGRAAALQVLAATAVSPWPGLDGAIVVWRGLRLVREIAENHGLRPGTAGTLRLFHRVTLDAGAVVATDVAVTALTEALFNSSVGGALAGQAAGSAVAARRICRLAFAVARASRPL
jgi:putative membrane protein